MHLQCIQCCRLSIAGKPLTESGLPTMWNTVGLSVNQLLLQRLCSDGMYSTEELEYFPHLTETLLEDSGVPPFPEGSGRRRPARFLSL